MLIHRMRIGGQSGGTSKQVLDKDLINNDFCSYLQCKVKGILHISNIMTAKRVTNLDESDDTPDWMHHSEGCPEQHSHD
jgi:hypothetical protein